MSRHASLTPDQALAACIANYGPRSAGGWRITAETREHVRRWLVANGVASTLARTLPIAELRGAWSDVSDKTLARLATRETEPETQEDDMDLDGIPKVENNVAEDFPPKDWQQQQAIRTEREAMATMNAEANNDPRMAALMSALSAFQGSNVDKAEVERICIGVVAQSADMLCDVISDKLNKPRPLAIKVNDMPKGELPALRHKCAEDLLQIIACGEHAYIVGPAGSGKTTAAEQVAHALGLTFYMQGAMAGSHELLGYKDAYGQYHTTPFRQAFEHGGLFLADEIDASDPAALLTMNAALANGHMAFPDQAEPVKRHENFRMIAAANTFGNGADRIYVGRSQLDGASLDRFSFLDWPYDEYLELQIASNEDWTRKVQRVRNAVSKLSIRHVVSPRASMRGAKLLQAGMAMDKVERIVLWRGLSDQDVSRIRDAM